MVKRFTPRDIPHIRQALALEGEDAQQASEQQFQQPLSTTSTRRVGLREWIGQGWNKLGAWFEHLPPFWTAYALTFTETVGASILALPIALAGVGPLPGSVLLLVMGVINLLTVASMAEAVTRNGSIRYQGNYLGRLVRDYLGRPSALLLTTMVVLINVLVLVAYYIGFSLTLAGATTIPAEVWAGILFVIDVSFVRRTNLQATTRSALVVGTINLGLIVLLSALALGHLQVEHLLYIRVPLLNGRPFEPALLGLIFGVIFTAYFGHFSVSNCARTVLQRDPGGRSLIWGCMAAQGSAMALYILWVVAVNGAVAPSALVDFSGTALTPLSRVVGPAVTIFGTLFAMLAMGMASIHFSLALFFTVREWMPTQSRFTLTLGRRQGRLILVPRGKANASLALTYLGLKGDATHSPGRYSLFRLALQLDAGTHRFEAAVQDTLEAAPLFAEFTPELPPNTIQCTMHISTASPDSVRMQLVTPMRLRYEAHEDTPGLPGSETANTDEMTMTGCLRGREPASVGEGAPSLGQTEQETQILLNRLGKQRDGRETGKYNRRWDQVPVAPGHKGQAASAFRKALDTLELEGPHKRALARNVKKQLQLKRVKAFVPGGSARSWLAMTPLLLIFLVIEWLLVRHQESFSQVVSFVGVVAIVVVAGVFPVLLLLASRRKGERVPSRILRFLGHPLLAGGIYLVAVSVLFLHGLLIWQNTIQRLAAILVGVAVLGVSYLILHKGAFARRVVIEVRQDQAAGQTEGTFLVTDAGQAATETRISLGYGGEVSSYKAATGAIANFPLLRSALFSLAGTKAQELRIWLHRVTPDGHSENLPALVRVSFGKEVQEFQTDAVREQLILPLYERAQKERNERTGEAVSIEVKMLSQTRSVKSDW